MPTDDNFSNIYLYEGISKNENALLFKNIFDLIEKIL